jgi:hypothetical protein
MPRIPAPPRKGWEKIRKIQIQYEFHVIIKHRIHNVLYLLSHFNGGERVEYIMNSSQHQATPMINIGILYSEDWQEY